MALSKVKISTFVELYNKACNIPNLNIYNVSGVNRDKEFFEPSKQVGSDTSKYKVVPPNYFACNLMHVGRDMVLPVAINHTNKDKYVSPAYTVFRIMDENIILKEYFFILLNSAEKDRYFWFHTDSSVRDGMEWDVFCDVEIEIPSISIQKQYIAIYSGIQENLDALIRSIEQMQAACDIYMESLIQTDMGIEIGKYIHIIDNRNEALEFGMGAVRGISNTKEIMPSKADVKENVIDAFYVIRPKEFVYNPRTTRMGDKVGLVYNNTESALLFTFNNIAFALNEGAEKELLPDYLYMFFRRSEFDRFARINSWGSATELFSFEDFGRYRIPLPSITVQQKIVDIFTVMNKRKLLCERLSKLQKKICPILIKGAIEEGGRA